MLCPLNQREQQSEGNATNNSHPKSRRAASPIAIATAGFKIRLLNNRPANNAPPTAMPLPALDTLFSVVAANYKNQDTKPHKPGCGAARFIKMCYPKPVIPVFANAIYLICCHCSTTYNKQYLINKLIKKL